MKFEHPLARSAKVWKAYPKEGDGHDLLVIVTTLELDPGHKKFKGDMVAKLQDSARAFLSEHPQKAAGYLLMNKPKL